MLSGPISQDSFSLGMVPAAAPNLIPSGGAYRLRNYLVDNDGAAYKRGGTVALASFGDEGLTFIWSGWLAGGHRTVVASPSKFGVLNEVEDDVIEVGGDGLAAPANAVEVAGILFIDGGWLYAGSRKTSSYSTGTVSIEGVGENGEPGSTKVTGTGTSWLSNADAGMLLKVGGRAYAVKRVVSDTELELASPFPDESVEGESYELAPILKAADVGVRPGPYATVASRLLSLEGNRVYHSAVLNPCRWNSDEDYHELSGGVQVLGAEPLGNDAVVFTTGGVWTIGNMAYEIVDPYGNLQQPEAQILRELVLWDRVAIAAWQEGLVVPALDGVWLISPSGPQMLSRSITPTYVGYINAGCRPGIAAVHKSHYFLPILDGAGEPVDLLVCRLDAPARTGMGVIFPWTNWRGAGARVSGLAQRVGIEAREPVLFGVEADDESNVLRMPRFEHDGEALDHDGSPVVPDVVLPDYATGPRESENFVKALMVRHETVGEGAEVEAFVSDAARPPDAVWGEFRWGDGTKWTDREEDEFDRGYRKLPGDEGQNFGARPAQWRVNRQTRFVRLRLRVPTGATRHVLRSVKVYVRQSGRL